MLTTSANEWLGGHFGGEGEGEGLLDAYVPKRSELSSKQKKVNNNTACGFYSAKNMRYLWEGTRQYARLATPFSLQVCASHLDGSELGGWGVGGGWLIGEKGGWRKVSSSKNSGKVSKKKSTFLYSIQSSFFIIWRPFVRGFSLFAPSKCSLFALIFLHCV